MIRTKSVYSPIDHKHDGLRILATRYRGRYMPTSRYDVWMPSLGPSEKLLDGIASGKITWAQFKTKYRSELRESRSSDRQNRTIKNHGQKFTLRLLQRLAKSGPVTIMCHCDENAERCHRYILRDILRARVG